MTSKQCACEGIGATLAECVMQHGFKKDMDLLSAHKKAKLDERNGSVTVTCSVCLCATPSSLDIVPCFSKGCVATWCGRQDLCDASRLKCTLCKHFFCEECWSTTPECEKCGSNVCPLCIKMCPTCKKVLCPSEYVKADTCKECHVNDLMAMEAIFQGTNQRTHYADY